jgi:hypothetical protein
LGVAVSGAVSRHFAWIAFAILWLLAYHRIRTANFSAANNLIAIAAGPPLFTYLLLRSRHAHENGQVAWKGRAYKPSSRGESASAEKEAARTIPGIKNQELRTDS